MGKNGGDKRSIIFFNVLRDFPPEFGSKAKLFTGEVMGHVEASSLETEVLYPLHESAVKMLRPDQLEKGRLDVRCADDGLVGPDLFRAPGGIVSQPHTHCLTVINNDFFYRTAGAEYCPMGHSTSKNGVEISVDVAAGAHRFGNRRRTHGGHTAQGRDGHPLHVAVGT